MSNITLAINDDIIRKVRRLAAERNTSLTALVRSNLEQLAAREDVRTEEMISQSRELFDTNAFEIGDKTWTRDDLHVRDRLL